MTRSTPIRIATIAATGFVAFIAGFSVSTAASAPEPASPIVDPAAWHEATPAPVEASAQPAKLTRPASAQCSPWDVSDVAMEEILIEMKRRGWRAPNQGDAMASLVADGAAGMYAADPYSPMPTGSADLPESSGESFITILSNEDAERLAEGDHSVLAPPS